MPSSTDCSRSLKIIFADETAKSKAFAKKRNLRGKTIGLLDDMTMYKSKLAYLAREAHKSGKLLRTWTFRGRVYARKSELGDAILISTIDELAEYIGIDPNDL